MTSPQRVPEPTTIVASTGDVYTWGHGWVSEPSTRNNTLLPWVDRSFIKHKIKSVSGAFDVVAVLTDPGEVLVWGLDGVTLDSVASTLRVVRVSCGGEFLALLTDAHEIWMCGDNTFGQLGHSDVNFQATPRQANGLAGKRVSMVACGYSHTAALTAAGDLYTWGRGIEGQLGHGKTKLEMTARFVRELMEQPVKAVACGANHTAAILLSGRILTWGEGSLGQLGHGIRVTSQLLPKQVEVKDGKVDVPLAGVAAGWGHTVVLSEDGRVWTWGFGKSGQLGTGEAGFSYLPQLVSALSGVPIKTVVCGSHFTVAAEENGNMYSWGSGEEGRLGLGDAQNRSAPTPITTIQDLGVNMFAFSDSRCLCVVPTRLTEIVPSKGPVTGGTQIELRGVGIYDCWIMVQFRNPPSKHKVVRGKYLAKKGAVRVDVPELDHIPRSGCVSVEVTLDDGATYTANGLTFAIYPPPKLTSITPRYRPLKGTVPLTLTGDGFTKHPEATIRLELVGGEPDPMDDLVVPAVFKSAGKGSYLCNSPEVSKAGDYVVELSFNGQNYTEDGNVVTYYADPSVSAVSPTCGVCNRPTELLIQGSGFVDFDGACRVRFATVEKQTLVKGKVLSPTQISVIAPVSSPGPCNIEVALNGINFTESGMRYIYYDEVKLSALSPGLGPASGGTEVALTGTGFVKVSSIKLSVLPSSHVDPPTTPATTGKPDAKAEAAKAEAAAAAAAALAERGPPQPIYVSGAVGATGNEIIFTIPPKQEFAPNNTALIALSLDGTNYFEDTLDFTYYNEPSYNDVKPNKLPAGKEASATIGGTGIFNSPAAKVLITGAPGGDLTVPGNYNEIKGGAEIQFTVPVAAVEAAGEIQVSVSMNGQQFSEKKSSITVVAGKK
mmetsp:Transcript_28782/g.66466  ORF Transcript_28782/g.66466 Transcript_28782/m.66466 type:complete len:888 (+) Transcript_28782:27-2690(+)